MDSQLLQEWLYLAGADYDSALLLQQMRPQHKEIICYHCQQSAEKYLKAYLYWKDETPPKIHNLTILCELCSAFDSTFDSLAPMCAYLTPFGSQPRYPHEINITDGTIVKALSYVEQISNFPPIATLRKQLATASS